MRRQALRYSSSERPSGRLAVDAVPILDWKVCIHTRVSIMSHDDE